MFKLIYRPGPGDGPEDKTIKGGFDLVVTPNKEFITKNAAMAVGLVDRVKRVEPADEATKARLVTARVKLKAAAEKVAAAARAKAEAEALAQAQAASLKPANVDQVDEEQPNVEEVAQ